MHRLNRRQFVSQSAQAGLAAGVLLPRCLTGADARPVPNPVVTFPGPWSFNLPKGGIILVNDQQLEDLQDPDKEVNLSLSSTPQLTTLRKLCDNRSRQGRAHSSWPSTISSPNTVPARPSAR